jgi:4-hydroxybenzoyl-CoA thioesterase
MPFRTRIKVRFGDEDHAQIVYYPRFFHFFHVAMEELFESAGFPFRKMFDEDRLGFPAVKIESDFRTPLRMGDAIDVEATVDEIGTKSVTFGYRVLRGDVTAASARITCVCLDMSTFASRPIPDAYRAFFEAHRPKG